MALARYVNSWMEHCILVYWSIHSVNSAAFLFSSIGDSNWPLPVCLLFAVLEGGWALPFWDVFLAPPPLLLYISLLLRISFTVRVYFSYQPVFLIVVYTCYIFLCQHCQ